MINLGAALAGGGGKRREGDFYPTPWEATVALLEEVKFPKRIKEPACGDGAMACVLEAYGYTVEASDIADHGYGGRQDFLTHEPVLKSEAWGVITNPPFKLAEEFVRRALRITSKVAMLLKATYPNAADRIKLFSEHPPSRVLPLTWRLDFTGGGAPTMDCTWFVWGIEGPPLTLLRKPKPEMNPVLR